MNKFIDTKGLQFKMWSYFTLFSVFILVMLWLFEIIFLNTYYESMKIGEIRKLTKEITQNRDSEDFEELLYQTAFNNGIIIQFYNADGLPLLGDGNPAVNRFSRANPNMISDLIKKLGEKENGDIISFIKENDRFNMRFVISATKFESSGLTFYLTLQAPLVPVTATTSVLKNQLLLITGILLVIAFILSYYIAKRISRPLSKITDTAENLAKGDYSVVFEKGIYTEINHLADTLNFATDELSKTDALRRDLIANVSHDLRTPLTIIKSYSEMIRDFSGENAEKRNSHINVIIDEADKMSALVNDILDLSRLESGTMVLNCTCFDMADIVKSIINRFAHCKEDGYEFIFDSGGPFYVNADEQQITQAAYNLINNAVNYTGEDKKVIISLSRNGENIRLCVTDTGQGIAESDIDKVWDRYYRLSYGRTRNAAGTGIGLSIVKNLLLAHNAPYCVESTLGKGSTFWFELKESIKEE